MSALDTITNFCQYIDNITFDDIAELYQSSDTSYITEKLAKAIANPVSWFGSLDTNNRARLAYMVEHRLH